MTTSLEHLSVDALDAALEDYVMSALNKEGGGLSERARREAEIMLSLYSQSARMQAAFAGLLRFVETHYPEVSMFQKIEYVFRQGFLMGWHARGAVVDSTELDKLYNDGENV